MLNPFIDVISTAIGLLKLALFIWIILQFLIQFNIVNAHQPFISRVMFYLNRVFFPLLDPIRRRMPDLGGLDLSPIILILLLQFIDSAMYHWLYDW